MKKLLSIIVAVSMLMATVPAAFALGETGYSDIDGTGYEGAVSILTTLGIMSGYTDGTFRPYSTVTRAELAAIGLQMRGISDYDEDVSIEEIQYKDMDGHWAAGAVAYARALGIIEGYDDGNFYPDEPATYEQALKVILSTLGYDYYCTLNGGYPQGYLVKANELKLASGVGVTVGSYITRGDLAKIIYNSLSVDMMQQTSYKKGEISYEVVSGETILTEYFNITKLRGIVEANDRTGIYGEATPKDGQVKIGDELFNVGSTGIADYLGYYVTFYALEDDSADNRTIISFKVESSKNNYIKLNAEYIENVSISSGRYVFEYRTNGSGSLRTVKTSDTPLIIYNGVALVDFVISDLAPENGQITLLDNDNDGRYDIVDVLAYDIMFVLNASEATGNIVAAYSTGVRGATLDVDDEDYYVRIMDGEGNTLPFSSIHADSVVSVALSKDEDQTVRTAIVSNDSVSGTIDGISDDGYFTINGVEYDTVSYMTESVGLAVGDTGTFYFSYDGKIAGFDGEAKLSKSMGMYIGYSSLSASHGGDQIKILKSDGTTALYQLAGKVKLNDVTYTGKEVFDMISDESNPLFGNYTSESNNAGRIIPLPEKAGMLYRLNSSGKISEIVTATATYGTADAETAELSVIKTIGMSSNYYYSTKYHCFHISDVKTYVTDNTVIFGSDDKESREGVDSSIYYVNTPASYYNNQNVYYPACYFYYINNKSYADFAIFYDNYDSDVSGTDDVNSGVDGYSMYEPVKIVDRVVETFDNEGEMVYRLVYWESGASKTTDFYSSNFNYMAYRDSEDLWRRGDMVNFVKTSGKISDIVSIFSGKVSYSSGVGTSWNDPSANEKLGNKDDDNRYLFPVGINEIWAYYYTYYNSSLVQRYLVGRVTSIDKLKYFSTFDLNYSSGKLTGEPLDGSCYRLIYDSKGYLSDVKDVGVGGVAEDQLVLVRKNGTSGTIGCRASEIFILYDASDFTDEQKKAYSSIYGDLFNTASVSSASAEGDVEIPQTPDVEIKESVDEADDVLADVSFDEII